MFEECVIFEAQAKYTTIHEIFLTLAKEIEWARDKFDCLERQWCALKTHKKSIEHGKICFLVHAKPFFLLKIAWIRTTN